MKQNKQIVLKNCRFLLQLLPKLGERDSQKQDKATISETKKIKMNKTSNCLMKWRHR